MTTETHAHDAHAGPDIRAYIVVFVALAIFTAASFFFNLLHRIGVINVVTSFVLILGVAVIKAVLVAVYFMHLKYDWKKVFFLVIPVLILAAMMITVFFPDQALSWLPFVSPYGFDGSASVPPPR